MFLLLLVKLCPTLLWRYGLQPARLLCQWDFTGKNTGVDCHFLLQFCIYITVNVWVTQLLCILDSIWCCGSFFILIGMLWHLIVALIYSFLMANAIETLIMYLFAIYMKCLFLSLTQFPTGFFFPLLSFRSSLYLLDTNPLSKMLSANISPSL